MANNQVLDSSDLTPYYLFGLNFLIYIMGKVMSEAEGFL